MKLMPQPDGRIAIVFTVAEDAVLDELGAKFGTNSRHFATVIYRQLMREDAPDLVWLIAGMGMPRG